MKRLASAASEDDEEMKENIPESKKAREEVITSSLHHHIVLADHVTLAHDHAFSLPSPHPCPAPSLPRPPALVGGQPLKETADGERKYPFGLLLGAQPR